MNNIISLTVAFFFGLVLFYMPLASAFPIETDNPDLQLRWNNTVRYNWAMRAQGRDSRIADNALFDQGDALFDKGDTISNRIDLLSEFDLFYRGRYGLRVTAAAWYDAAYGNHGKSNPDALGSAFSPVSYVNNEFTSYVKRYYAGPSGEFLDAFVFGTFDLGSTVWGLKLGRHSQVWGEALFGSTHAVSYAQVPSDGMKAVTNPGASAKETAIPINQLSVSAQITPELTILAQTLFEWRPNRVPEGGTFFGGADFILEGPNVNRLSDIEGDRGDVGLGVKWSPQWLDGTLGIYLRHFDDKGAWVAQVAGGGRTRAVYAHDIELWGVTLAKNIGGVSVGAELSHRSDAPLTSSGSVSAGAAGGFEGARGDTWHGVLNATTLLEPTQIYNFAVLAAELSWSRLDHVTENENLYRAKGFLAACDRDAKMQGCANEQYASLTASLTPTWLQVFPGVDLSMPMFITRSFGNAPTNAGGNDGFTIWKIGLSANAYSRHQFDLAYTGYEGRIEEVPGSLFGTRILGAPYEDKGWLSFTYQFTF